MAMVIATNKAPQKISSKEITYTGSICKKCMFLSDLYTEGGKNMLIQPSYTT
jgi:hypothetical protein